MTLKGVLKSCNRNAQYRDYPLKVIDGYFFGLMTKCGGIQVCHYTQMLRQQNQILM